MDTNELRAAIERAKSEGTANQREWWLICDLAEIGRLAVEASDIAFKKLSNKSGRVAAKYARNAAIDAFLAARKGGER